MALSPSSGVEPWADVPELAIDPERLYYVEDFTPGRGGKTMGRTITEADIINFASYSWDYNPLYLDAEYAAGSMFGARIAPAMLTFNYAYGLWTWQYFASFPKNEGEAAGHLTDRATFLAPVMLGDTIYCQYRVASNRRSASKPQVGIVTYDLQVFNQRKELVQEGQVLMMVPAKGG